MTLTETQARLTAVDAGDRSMRDAGREAWNEQDAQVAADVFALLWPVPVEAE